MRNKKSGFTLLELIIALSLMAILSITTTQVIRNSTTRTKKITEGIDTNSQLRTVFNIFKSDVEKAFNYRNITFRVYQLAQIERAKGRDKRINDWIKKKNTELKVNPPISKTNIPSNLQSEYESVAGPEPKPEDLQIKPVDPITHFVGDSEKVFFTTASGFRFRKTEPVSNLMEVGYKLKPCKSLKFRNTESTCLWRSISYNIDEDVTEGGAETVILEFVDDFDLQYLSFEQTDTPDWQDDWDSRNLTDARTGGRFPSAVMLKIKLKVPKDKNELQKKEGKTYNLTGVFQVKFPNNNAFEGLEVTDISTPETGTGAPQEPAPPEEPQEGDPEGGEN